MTARPSSRCSARGSAPPGPRCGACSAIFEISVRLSKVTSGLYLFELLERLLRLDRVRVDDLVPDEVLALPGRETPDLLVDEHELRERRHVEARARLVERLHDLRRRVRLHGVVRLHARQVALERGVVRADRVVVDDHERRAVLGGQRLEQLLGEFGHEGSGLSQLRELGTGRHERQTRTGSARRATVSCRTGRLRAKRYGEPRRSPAFTPARAEAGARRDEPGHDCRLIGRLRNRRASSPCCA